MVSPIARQARDQQHSERSLQLAVAAARTAVDHRGQDVLLLDMRKQTSLFDYFVVATGTSGRQLRAISDEIDRVLQRELGDQRMGIEGYQESRWIVLDYGTVVVHLFEEQMRGYYGLENLWADATRLDLEAAAARL